MALFQGTTIFGLAPLPYSLIVMGVGWILDNVYDTFFAPRIMANVLKLHPAAVLVGVLVGLNLFGLMGMLLAPPILATLKVLLRYVERKLLDKDPWEIDVEAEAGDDEEKLIEKVVEKVKDGASTFLGNIKNNEKDDDK